MTKYVVGNWKMNGSRAEGDLLAAQVQSHIVDLNNHHIHTVICPPATMLQELSAYSDDGLKFGGQTCHVAETGAHTGEISAEMLKDCGATYVIVGHSERRADSGETSPMIATKALAAKRAGLTPIICIGETLQQRESGAYEPELAGQIEGSIPEAFAATDYLLAYEPVWAIGTGKVADEETIEKTHGFIASQLPAGAKILYGGSVKPDNAQSIMSIKHVDGVLVGGASLSAESFNAIIAAASKTV